ncbi:MULTISPECIES: MarR family winged helix-turn-helix transcriptional regulator [Dietzia]|uniref:MarR family transcriptional regulator n=1 Tax=Dietzia maris TaxID=37915 RepID=A0ABT8H0T2_9ACTN|nr:MULTISPECIES: MarR family transcriptional regulator [Dietzia]MCZ4539324.1 MarR family transcriptional regulator [Dietzia maris]MDN4506075.1 MarR family transcriptional regulator [Dietzia maris]MDV3354702.1 MarR family transcriptional regulator [Dietzia sp. IN118]
MPPRTAPIPDRIDQARANWEREGWTDAAQGMTVVTSVMRAHQILLARVEDTLRPWNLSFPRYELLRLLAFSRSGALPITKASERLQVHVTSVTSAMKRLLDAGLVERRPHPTDGRTTLVEITAEGRQVVAEATAALNSGVFAEPGMDQSEQVALIEAIASLRRSAGDF